MASGGFSRSSCVVFMIRKVQERTHSLYVSPSKKHLFFLMHYTNTHQNAHLLPIKSKIASTHAQPATSKDSNGGRPSKQYSPSSACRHTPIPSCKRYVKLHKHIPFRAEKIQPMLYFLIVATLCFPNQLCGDELN